MADTGIGSPTFPTYGEIQTDIAAAQGVVSDASSWAKAEAQKLIDQAGSLNADVESTLLGVVQQYITGVRDMVNSFTGTTQALAQRELALAMALLEELGAEFSVLDPSSGTVGAGTASVPPASIATTPAVGPATCPPWFAVYPNAPEGTAQVRSQDGSLPPDYASAPDRVYLSLDDAQSAMSPRISPYYPGGSSVGSWLFFAYFTLNSGEIQQVGWSVASPGPGCYVFIRGDSCLSQQTVLSALQTQCQGAASQQTPAPPIPIVAQSPVAIAPPATSPTTPPTQVSSVGSTASGNTPAAGGTCPAPTVSCPSPHVDVHVDAPSPETVPVNVWNRGVGGGDQAWEQSFDTDGFIRQLLTIWPDLNFLLQPSQSMTDIGRTWTAVMTSYLGVWSNVPDSQRIR